MAGDLPADEREAASEHGSGQGEEAIAHLARLRLITRAFADVIDLHEVVGITMKQAAAVLPGARGLLVGMLAEDRLEIVGSTGYDRDVLVEDASSLPITDAFPLTDAIVRNEAIWLGSRAEQDERYPEQADREPGTEAFVALPLWVEGEAVGVIAIAFDDQRRFDRSDRLFLLTLADVCANVIARVSSSAQRSSTAGFMRPQRAERRRWAGWIVMAVAILGPLALTFAFASVEDPVALRPTSSFMAVIVLVAAFGGLRPALLASIISILGVWWTVVPPRTNFALESLEDATGLLLFAGACLVVTWIVYRLEATQDALVDQRRREARNREAVLERAVTVRAAEAEAMVRFRSLVEATTAIVCTWDADGRFVDEQRAWSAFTGQDAQECRGAGWVQAFQPDDRSRIARTWASARAEGTVYEETGRLCHADSGTHRWCTIRAVPLRDGDHTIVEWLGTVTDVHVQTEAQEQIAAATARLSTLMSSAPVGFAFIDPELRFALVNDKLAELHGLPADGLIGHPVGDVLADLAEAAGAVMSQVLASGEAVLDLELTLTAPGVPEMPRDWLTNFYPVRLPDGEIIGLGMTVIELTERNRLLEAERDARRTAERLSKSLEQLQGISDLALGALSLDDLLEAITGRLQALLAVDTVRIIFATEDASMLAGGTMVGLDPERESAVAVPVGAGFAGLVASTLEPVVLDDVTEFSFYSAELGGRGLHSVAGVPLVSSDRLVGVLHVGSVTTRHFSDEEVDLLRLAGERIASAIERVRHVEVQQAARERSEFLNTVNDELIDAVDRAEIMTRVTRAAVPRLGDWCSIHLIRDDPRDIDVELAHADPAKSESVGFQVQSQTYDPEEKTGVAAVIRTGEAQFYPSLSEELVDDLDETSEIRTLATRHRVTSAMFVPLRTAAGVVGALRFAATTPGRRFSTSDFALAAEVAVSVGSALANARLFEVQREISETLQHSLLPTSMPTSDAVDLAVRYWPAGVGAEAGGDFYDILELGDSTWGVLIGDVSGKGVSAAAVTALARHTLRAAARHERRPSATLRWLHDAMREYRTELFCTAIFGRLRMPDPSGGARFTMSAGGHPLPVLLGVDGSVRFVGEHGSLIGLVDPATFSDNAVDLVPGDMLVLYTDGVTDVPGIAGLDDDQLLDLLDRCRGGTAEETAERIGAALDARRSYRERTDDTALLILRMREEFV